jgi:hypothetical protein
MTGAKEISNAATAAHVVIFRACTRGIAGGRLLLADSLTILSDLVFDNSRRNG